MKIFSILVKSAILTALIFAFGSPAQSLAKDTSTSTSIGEDPSLVKPLDVGQKVPNISLKNADGLSVNLPKLLSQRPTLLVFYRGGWCMYCNKHFGQLKTVENDLEKLGYQIIGISPDKVGKIRESLKKHQLDYMLLSDSAGKAMQAFHLAFRLDDQTFKKYQSYGIDIEKDSGHSHRLLPVPTAYIIDQQGVIRWRYTNPDYKVRANPQEVLKAARQNLKK